MYQCVRNRIPPSLPWSFNAPAFTVQCLLNGWQRGIELLSTNFRTSHHHGCRTSGLSGSFDTVIRAITHYGFATAENTCGRIADQIADINDVWRPLMSGCGQSVLRQVSDAFFEHRQLVSFIWNLDIWRKVNWAVRSSPTVLLTTLRDFFWISTLAHLFIPILSPTLSYYHA